MQQGLASALVSTLEKQISDHQGCHLVPAGAGCCAPTMGQAGSSYAGLWGPAAGAGHVKGSLLAAVG